MKSAALAWMVLLLIGTSHSQRFVEGEVYHDIVGRYSDTTVNLINYAYYEDPVSAVQRAVNAKITHRLESWWKVDSAPPVLSHSYFEQLISNFEADFNENGGEDYIMAWELEIGIQIEEFENTIQLTMTEWAYAGGAHGNSSYKAWVFDKITGKELSVSDFFKDAKEVNAIFEKVFRKQAEIDADLSLDEAGYWFEDNVFALNSNFYFSGISMHVYFNTYEITDYATGPTELEVPLDILRPLMIREF